MIDAASGGALVDKTPMEAKNLIANMAANSQQFGDRYDTPLRRVNEVGVTSSHLDQQLASLTKVVQTLATLVANICHAQSKPCGVCLMVGHMTDMCPTLQEGSSYEQVNALRISRATKFSRSNEAMQ